MTEQTTDAPTDLEQGIRAVLAEHGRLAVDVDALTDDTDLYASGLTSHASVTLMLACEDTWDVEFPQQLLRKSTFGSIGSIRAALEELGVGS